MKRLQLTSEQNALVQVFRALGNPARFRILQILTEKQACVCGEVVRLLPLAQSTISEHLKVLKDAGLIQGAIEGPATCYCIDPSAVGRWQRRVAALFPPAESSSATERMMSESSSVGPNGIKKAVEERYADQARRHLATIEVLPATGASACCGPDAGASSCASGDCGTGYRGEDLAALPSSVTGISLGCGNPVGLADAQAGETVVDLGSGGGIDCFLAASRVGEAGHVIGVDMTPDMIRLARANAEKVGAQNVEFRLGEIEHLPIDPNSVDLVISNCVVNLVPDKAAVYREVYRVLKPGGRLVIADTVADRPVPEALRAKLDTWGQCASGSLDRETYLNTLRTAGFDRIDVLDEHAVDWGDLDDVKIGSITLRAYKPR